MTKKRKSLNDSLASEFVFGEDKPKVEAKNTPKAEKKAIAIAGESESTSPTQPKLNEKLITSSSLMEKLQVEAKEGTKRFTIDLKESVHRKLSILSAKTGRSKADIIRMVLDDVLEEINE